MLKTLQGKQKQLEMKKEEQGLTFIEMLVVIIIIAVVATLLLVAFLGVFGQVDGTEKLAESRSIEGAVLQASLSDSDRRIPAVGYDSVEKNAEANDRMNSTFHAEEAESFSQTYGAWVFAKVASDAFGAETAEAVEALQELVFELDTDEIGRYIDGGIDEEETYYVVVRQEQISFDNRPAQNGFEGYNDGLAGKVFTETSIQDSDGVLYNGSFSFDGEDITDDLKGLTIQAANGNAGN